LKIISIYELKSLQIFYLQKFILAVCRRTWRYEILQWRILTRDQVARVAEQSYWLGGEKKVKQEKGNRGVIYRI
jgi:hypothetical protein